MSINQNKKGNWELTAVFGAVGLAMFLDSIFLKIILPTHRIAEGFIGIVLIILAIFLYLNKN
ncbi:MAG: hypothetical protein WC781_02140 [Candidatus Pacearchaeota archaeon]|jgi:hypothetical protein